jgi:hypothetical protein
MKKLVILFFSLCSVLSFAQTDLIAYSHDYEFTEGIFLTVNHFKQNNPITRSSIVSSIPKSEIDFFKQLVEQKNISCKDTSKKEKMIETATIWGYCQNRAVYINFNKQFNRLNVIGTLCHFTATITTNVGYHDAMSNRYGMGMSNVVQELRQFVYDTQNNKIYDFDEKNMEVLLKNSDQDLYNQFMLLKKREKSNAIFVYLRKYNEKHPLYLPQQ